MPEQIQEIEKPSTPNLQLSVVDKLRLLRDIADKTFAEFQTRFDQFKIDAVAANRL